MKKFNHVPVELQDIKATNKDGIRLYETPDGNIVSIYYNSSFC